MSIKKLQDMVGEKAVEAEMGEAPPKRLRDLCLYREY